MKSRVAGLIGGVDGGVIGGEHELDALDLHVLSIPVVGVLLVHHGLVVLPLGQHVRAGGDEAGLGSPSVGVEDIAVLIQIALGALDLGLLHREEGGEGAQVQHVGAGRSHLNGEGLAILGGAHGQIVRIALDAVEHVAVVGGGGGRSGTLPAPLEVLGGQVASVGPLQAVTQGEGVHQAVVAHGVAGSEVRHQLALSVVGVQAAEGVDRQRGAVHRAVERGVQLVRLGSQVHAQGGVIALVGIHEELVAEEVAVDVGHSGILHVQVVVVVDRQDGARSPSACPQPHA